MSAAGFSQNNLGFQLSRGDDYGTKSAPQIVGRCVLRKVAAEISFTSFAIAERLLMLTTPLLNWRSIADFSVLTIVAYWLLNWARQTRVLRLLTGIGAMVFLGSLTGRLELVITAWIFHLAAIASVLLLVVVYQVEIRHALTRLDPLNRLVHAMPLESTSDSTAIADAAFSLAANHRGALIVLARRDRLDNLLHGGIPLGGTISREILEAVFRKMSPVHDGAVVVEDGRIARVGVVLPLTRREDLPLRFGTRHRAALGLTEQSDARVIVVSEERGEVSLAEGAAIVRVESAPALALQIQATDRESSSPSHRRLFDFLFADLKLKSVALAVAGLIWGLVFMSGASVRTFVIPIEFEDVPPGLEVSDSSSDVLSVQLRGATRLFSTLEQSQLVVTVDLKGMRQGIYSIVVGAENLHLPPGIFLERALPATIRVRLEPRPS
jgi:diadenylate cyclase